MENENRQGIRDSIQASGPDKVDGVVVGWVAVVEWMDVEGHSWLTRLDGDAADEALTTWRREGYLHNALNTDWSEE